MWNGLISIVLTLGAAYLVLAGLLYAFQGRFIYYPERELVATPAQVGLEYEVVSFETSDGITLSGWFVPAADARGVLLFLHGNAGNISHRMLSLEIFNRLGLSTFIFDYRGFGESQGRPDEIGTYRDAEAAWRYLTEQRKLDPARIVIFGRSLGAAIASYLAGKYTPRALIVESAFTNVPDLAARFYRFMPVRWLSRFRYPTVDYVARVAVPVLVVHSRDDDIVPFRQGRQVFAAANPPKEFLEIRGNHNDGFFVTGAAYVDGLERFLSNTAELRPAFARD
ncbi:MAG: alpha/beta hydrolase [Gammaproteobacteria bacterium]|nr:MAG: alpha/beta hydrolase [Gammaproteobacteria bacterium]